MSYKIHDFFKKSSFVSGEEIAKKLQISRVAVHKQIQKLRSQGYIIEGIRGRGYRLIPRSDGLLPLELKARLETNILGREIITLETVDSTQNFIRELAEKGAPEGTLVIALEQEAGRGRMGRKWFSPEGGLWFSILLRPPFLPKEIYKLTLLFGVAIAISLKNYGLKPSLKWPNDVLINQKKVCGILLESSLEADRVDYVIVGIGLNANFPINSLPEEIRTNSTSLYEVLNRKIDRAELLCKILKNSEYLYLNAIKEGFLPIISIWKSLSSMLGKMVEVKLLKESIRGIAIDIDEDGSLVLNENGKLKKIYSGDIQLI
ncbi:MAG: biotin--[acetyl-CoA-carboxylase] ligase [Nitrososphaerota archaeon]|nr:biotin--[acetyl-CoA-carboxylase] ligase [Nitrososphaerota archaeon]